MPVEMPEKRNSALIQGLLPQTGSLFTFSSTPVYPASASPASAPTIDTILPIGLPGACNQRPLPTTASTNDTNETAPNTNRICEPNDIGEYGLKIGRGK